MSQLFGGATRLVKGVDKFRRKVFGTQEDLFRKLGKGQSPLALFITCSDSRINPNLLTQTEPGELFILRNAGNLIPPAGSGGGEEATIEYALVQLKIKDVFVCGHSHCGAMNGLLAPTALEKLPCVKGWLTHAKAILPDMPPAGSVSPEEMLAIAIEKNVLLQVEHLKTLPSVIAALAAGKLRIHAWVYQFETGEVVAHDPKKGRFVPLGEAPHQKFVKEVLPLTGKEDEWHDSI